MNPLLRELKILFYRWARHDLRHKPGDPGMSEAIIALNDLYRQRPQQTLRSSCQRHAGLCMGDARCPDTRCENHPMRLNQRNGGAHIDTGTATPIQMRDDMLDTTRIRIGIAGAAATALLAAALHALGLPVPFFF